MLMLNWFPSSAAIFFRQFAWGGLLLAVMAGNAAIDRVRRGRGRRETGPRAGPAPESTADPSGG